MHHIVGVYAVLAAMCLIRHNENVVVRIDGFGIGFIKLLDEREYEAGVSPQFLHKVIAAGCYKLSRLCLPQQTAVFKCIADLFVQLITVCENDYSRRPFKLAPYLL